MKSHITDSNFSKHVNENKEQMSEESEEDALAVGRRQRLRLARWPWASMGGDGRWSRVSVPVFAESNGGDELTMTDEEEQEVWSTASSVGSWSAPKVVRLPPWALIFGLLRWRIALMRKAR
jgi:hypothetical protein